MSTTHLTEGEKGTTLIEIATILPLLLWLTFGIIDFGRYLYVANVVQSAAQAGARAGLGQDGIVNLADAANVARQNLVTLDPTDVTVLVAQPTLETVEVKVTHRFAFITPLLAAMFAGNQIEIDGAASMIIF